MSKYIREIPVQHNGVDLKKIIEIDDSPNEIVIRMTLIKGKTILKTEESFVDKKKMDFQSENEYAEDLQKRLLKYTEWFIYASVTEILLGWETSLEKVIIGVLGCDKVKETTMSNLPESI